MLNLTADVVYKDGSIIANSYQAIDENGNIPAGDVLFRVEQLDSLAQAQGKKALLITVETSPEEHQFPLAELDAIFIEFAGFADGRGYSFATLLRRQGFKGELRAVGDVFKDVLNYLKRSGFDSFVLKEGKNIQDAVKGLNDFTTPYQASTAVEQANYQTGK
ncbi:DUF934 domain-containing protein [Moraxella sp. ZY210820]|uniref:DUF934 domain-containing protein n=1 Tax=unclassified Moraxella TaxID=2685852 RepID=UPI00272F7F52|nr:DUF934 domain-containing protein [Moraxella sp. ZY210820]WLF83989.1 DUF934 domain-containing protein [Moraxella sp. ZY210820]